MKLIEKIRRIERVNALIRRKATGCPTNLARKLEVSERCVYRVIDDMKTMGFPIKYCRLRETYYYTKNIEVNISFEINDLDMPLHLEES